MKSTSMSIHPIRLDREAPATSADCSTPAQSLFVELVQILEQIKNSPQADSGEQSIERWEDDSFIYLETDLEGIFDSEIDINIHDGRFYLRSVR
jgi:HSP20 family molecular chaperone IbpA